MPTVREKAPIREQTVEQLTEHVRQNRARTRLTPDQIDDLHVAYREVCLADDEEAKALMRAITAKLRRVTHDEIHPDCKEVEFTVPQAPDGSFFTINEKPYFGTMILHECVARALAERIAHARLIESERLRDNGKTVDLDRNVAELARRIQAA